MKTKKITLDEWLKTDNLIIGSALYQGHQKVEIQNKAIDTNYLELLSSIQELIAGLSCAWSVKHSDSIILIETKHIDVLIKCSFNEPKIYVSLSNDRRSNRILSGGALAIEYLEKILKRLYKLEVELNSIDNFYVD